MIEKGKRGFKKLSLGGRGYEQLFRCNLWIIELAFCLGA